MPALLCIAFSGNEARVPHFFIAGDNIMIIKLFQPPTKNWLVMAENLNDPAGWDRFVPCHTTASERWQFECAVKVQAATNGLSLKLCKDLLKRGACLFEYDWNTDDDDILQHAMQVAERLNLDLLIEEPSTSNAA
jgi:hypothetical protein